MTRLKPLCFCRNLGFRGFGFNGDFLATFVFFCFLGGRGGSPFVVVLVILLFLVSFWCCGFFVAVVSLVLFISCRCCSFLLVVVDMLLLIVCCCYCYCSCFCSSCCCCCCCERSCCCLPDTCFCYTGVDQITTKYAGGSAHCKDNMLPRRRCFPWNTQSTASLFLQDE